MTTAGARHGKHAQRQPTLPPLGSLRELAARAPDPCLQPDTAADPLAQRSPCRPPQRLSRPSPLRSLAATCVGAPSRPSKPAPWAPLPRLTTALPPGGSEHIGWPLESAPVSHQRRSLPRLPAEPRRWRLPRSLALVQAFPAGALGLGRCRARPLLRGRLHLAEAPRLGLHPRQVLRPTPPEAPRSLRRPRTPPCLQPRRRCPVLVQGLGTQENNSRRPSPSRILRREG